MNDIFTPNPKVNHDKKMENDSVRVSLRTAWISKVMLVPFFGFVQVTAAIRSAASTFLFWHLLLG